MASWAQVLVVVLALELVLPKALLTMVVLGALDFHPPPFSSNQPFFSPN
jgi:hypothetical protein